jgi:hypothetical protein
MFAAFLMLGLVAEQFFPDESMPADTRLWDSLPRGVLAGCSVTGLSFSADRNTSIYRVQRRPVADTRTAIHSELLAQLSADGYTLRDDIATSEGLLVIARPMSDNSMLVGVGVNAHEKWLRRRMDGMMP